MQVTGLGVHAGPRGERLLYREAIPADEPVAHDAFHRLSEETRHNRFMAAVSDIPETILEGLRNPDPARQLFLAVFRLDDEGREVEPVGAARLVHNADGATCDFGMVLADAWQGRGVGTRLLGVLVDNARARGLESIRGDVLASNDAMLALAQSLGFSVADSAEEGPRVKVVTKTLRAAA